MANKLLNIHTPRGVVRQVRGKTGGVELKLEWNPRFGPGWTAHLQGVQAQFDKRVLALTDPYVPLDTGLLKNTASMASSVGDGELIWAAPYAAAQYYRSGSAGSITGPLRGPRWGERMKADHEPELEEYARKLVKSKK